MNTDPAEVKKFFDSVIVDYNCGDIDWLRANMHNKAGPLLASVMNGIDTLGGMMDGFSHGGMGNSRKRSVDFMTKRLRLKESVAELLYSHVRCGIAHESVTKLAITFYVDESKADAQDFLWKSPKNWIFLNVSGFALRYRQEVDEISRDVSSLLHHVPTASSANMQTFSSALATITALCDEQGVPLDAKGTPDTRGAFSKGVASGTANPLSSSSASQES